MNLRIVTIVPAGYPYSGAFDELVNLFKSALESANYTCDTSINNFSRDKLNIVLGGHLLPMNAIPGGIQYIIYQTEQIERVRKRFPAVFNAFMSTMEGAMAVWDYSKSNVDYLNSRGINISHLPPGYHPALESINGSHDKSIDVLFYGKKKNRRIELLENISSHEEINFRYLTDVYGAERDRYIAKSKIVLNVHAHDKQALESIRLSYLLNNRVFVITEKSQDDPYISIPIIRVSSEDFLSASLYYLNNVPERSSCAESCYRAFVDHFPMQKMVHNQIEDLRQ